MMFSILYNVGYTLGYSIIIETISTLFLTIRVDNHIKGLINVIMQNNKDKAVPKCYLIAKPENLYIISLRKHYIRYFN